MILIVWVPMVITNRRLVSGYFKENVRLNSTLCRSYFEEYFENASLVFWIQVFLTKIDPRVYSVLHFHHCSHQIQVPCNEYIACIHTPTKHTLLGNKCALQLSFYLRCFWNRLGEQACCDSRETVSTQASYISSINH